MRTAQVGVVRMLTVVAWTACVSSTWAQNADAPATEGRAVEAAPTVSPEDAFRMIYIMPRPPAEQTPTTRPVAAPRTPGRSRALRPNASQGRPELNNSRAKSAVRPAAAGIPDEDDLRAAGLSDPRPPLRDSDGPYANGGFGLGVAAPYSFYGYGLGYGGRRLPDRRREWNDYIYFGGRPGDYGFGSQDYYGDSALGEAYRFGFNRGYFRGYFDKTGNERTEHLLQSAHSAMDRGLISFREGRYREAADAFRLACDTNQGDPSARIYAAHALFATGRYRDAVKYLREAFRLQPRIAYLTFDMRSDYRQPEEFEKQVAALDSALDTAPRDEDRLFMLGYVLYFGGQREMAYYTFQRLVRVNPRDKLAAQLMDNCQPPDVAVNAPPPSRGKALPAR